MESGEWRVENGECRVKNGEWKIAAFFANARKLLFFVLLFLTN